MQIFDITDQWFSELSKTINLQDDLLKVVVAWLLCIPLGFVHDLLRDRFIRNSYSLICGLFLSYMCIRSSIFLTLAISIVTYLLTSILQRRCAIPVFIFNFAFLLSLNIHRYITDPMGWKMDGTSSVMLMICKLIYFSFYVADGRIATLPNMLDYLGYVYFYPSAIVGPTFNYLIYDEFISRKGNYAKIPQFAKFKASMLHLFLAILYMLGFKFIYPYFPIEIFKSEWFFNSNLFIKILILNPMGMITRFKYFIAWKLSQAGMNAAGITYNGNENFNRIQSMGDRFEIEPNPRFKTEMWNSSVQAWLKDCFYDQFAPKYGPNKSLFLTFVISAIWHGVHPIYFFGFIQWALTNETSKQIYRARSKFTWLKEPYKTILVWILGGTALSYMGFGIALLDWDTAMNFYKSMYFLPTILQVVIYIFLTTTKWGFEKSKKDHKNLDNLNKEVPHQNGNHKQELKKE